MNIIRPEDKTATLGLDQGYRPLHIRAVSIDGHNAMESHWAPEADELAALNAGGHIVLTVLGNGHPPVRLDVLSAAESPDDKVSPGLNP